MPETARIGNKMFFFFYLYVYITIVEPDSIVNYISTFYYYHLVDTFADELLDTEVLINTSATDMVYLF